MRLKLVNGWTLSIAPDLHKPFYSVAAWPTDDPEVVSTYERRWFVFESGCCEERILDLSEFVELAAYVAASAAPESNAVAQREP